MSQIIWVSTVDTDYPITAVAGDSDTAVLEAAKAALDWLLRTGHREFATPEDVVEYFGVRAIAVPMGKGVLNGQAQSAGLSSTAQERSSDPWERVLWACERAVCVAWDGCHKLYVALDDSEADWFRTNYAVVVDSDPAAMLTALEDWWEQSCPLRFIQSVRGGEFKDLIAQFEGDDEEDDLEDEDDDNDDNEEDES